MAANAAYKAMVDTEIKFTNINYKEAAKYIASNWSEAQVATSNIRRVLPWRKEKGGTRPGMKNINILGPGVNQEKEWRFRLNVELTSLEKKRILAHEWP